MSRRRTRKRSVLLESSAEWVNPVPHFGSSGDIVIVGNSITEGLSAPNRNDGWVSLLGDALNGTHGRGYHPARTGGGTNHWTLTNTSTLSSSSTDTGFGLWSLVLIAGDTLVKTMECDAITVVTSQQSTSFFGAALATVLDVYVDDVKVGEIDTYDASLANDEVRTHQTTSFDLGGSVTDHTIRLQTQGVVGSPIPFVRVEGVFGHQGNLDTGYRVWNGGHVGFNIGAFNNFNSWGILSRGNPALVVIQETYNNLSVDTATFRSRFNTTVQQIRSRTQAPVLFVTEYQTGQYVVAGRWEEHRTVLAEIADANRFSFFDLGGVIGSLGFNGVVDDPCEFLADTNHPGLDGHAFIAQAYGQYLAGDVVDTWCP